MINEEEEEEEKDIFTDKQNPEQRCKKEFIHRKTTEYFLKE